MKQKRREPRPLVNNKHIHSWELGDIMKYNCFQKAVCIVLSVFVCLTAVACSNAVLPSDSGTKDSSSDYEITFDPAPVPTPEELMEPTTHIMFALCAGVSMDDKNPGQVLFYFLPIKCLMGELEEVPLNTTSAYYGYEAILVKGDVNDYQLDNVYAKGNAYELYLKEHKSGDGEVYYTDLLPYSEVLKIDEIHEYCYDEEYVSKLEQYGIGDRAEQIEKDIQRIEKSRENVSLISSTYTTMQ